MTEQEILKSIEIILYNAEYTNKSGWRFYGAKPKMAFEGDSEFEYRNKTVELLLALHQKLTPKEKEFLLKSLEPKVGFFIFVAKQPKTGQFVLAHQDFVFMFLIKIKELDRALKMISDKIIITKTTTQLLHVLSEMLIHEPQTFDNTKLDEILLFVDKFQSFIYHLKAYWEDRQHSLDGIKFTPAYDVTKIDNYKATDSSQVTYCENLFASIKDRAYKIEQERLSASLLEGINYEVNQDQEQLQNIIAEFGFNKKLNEIILKINEKLYDAKDPFDFKNCIDLIRAFLNELCMSIALEIENKKQIQPTVSIDSMGTAEQYFRDKKVNFLNQAEHDFIVKYNAFISAAGVHALQSEKEYARISKNLVIELGLFLVEKLKKYLS